MARSRKTSSPRVAADGTKTYGPYSRKGVDGKRNDRDIVVKKKGGKTTSTTAARDAKERATGRTLAKDEHVAHKSGTDRKSNSPSDTTIKKASKNIGDGNRAR